jgi:hypothetical protein
VGYGFPDVDYMAGGLARVGAPTGSYREYLPLGSIVAVTHPERGGLFVVREKSKMPHPADNGIWFSEDFLEGRLAFERVWDPSEGVNADWWSIVNPYTGTTDYGQGIIVRGPATDDRAGIQACFDWAALYYNDRVANAVGDDGRFTGVNVNFLPKTYNLRGGVFVSLVNGMTVEGNNATFNFYPIDASMTGTVGGEAMNARSGNESWGYSFGAQQNNTKQMFYVVDSMNLTFRNMKITSPNYDWNGSTAGWLEVPVNAAGAVPPVPVGWGLGIGFRLAGVDGITIENVTRNNGPLLFAEQYLTNYQEFQGRSMDPTRFGGRPLIDVGIERNRPQATSTSRVRVNFCRNYDIYEFNSVYQDTVIENSRFGEATDAQRVRAVKTITIDGIDYSGDVGPSHYFYIYGGRNIENGARKQLVFKNNTMKYAPVHAIKLSASASGIFDTLIKNNYFENPSYAIEYAEDDTGQFTHAGLKVISNVFKGGSSRVLGSDSTLIKNNAFQSEVTFTIAKYNSSFFPEGLPTYGKDVSTVRFVNNLTLVTTDVLYSNGYPALRLLNIGRTRGRGSIIGSNSHKFQTEAYYNYDFVQKGFTSGSAYSPSLFPRPTYAMKVDTSFDLTIKNNFSSGAHHGDFVLRDGAFKNNYTLGQPMINYDKTVGLIASYKTDVRNIVGMGSYTRNPYVNINDLFTNVTHAGKDRLFTDVERTYGEFPFSKRGAVAKNLSRGFGTAWQRRVDSATGTVKINLTGTGTIAVPSNPLQGYSQGFGWITPGGFPLSSQGAPYTGTFNGIGVNNDSYDLTYPQHYGVWPDRLTDNRDNISGGPNALVDIPINWGYEDADFDFNLVFGKFEPSELNPVETKLSYYQGKIDETGISNPGAPSSSIRYPQRECTQLGYNTWMWPLTGSNETGPIYAIGSNAKSKLVDGSLVDILGMYSGGRDSDPPASETRYVSKNYQVVMDLSHINGNPAAGGGPNSYFQAGQIYWFSAYDPVDNVESGSREYGSLVEKKPISPQLYAFKGEIASRSGDTIVIDVLYYSMYNRPSPNENITSWMISPPAFSYPGGAISYDPGSTAGSPLFPGRNMADGVSQFFFYENNNKALRQNRIKWEPYLQCIGGWLHNYGKTTYPTVAGSNLLNREAFMGWVDATATNTEYFKGGNVTGTVKYVAGIPADTPGPTQQFAYVIPEIWCFQTERIGPQAWDFENLTDITARAGFQQTSGIYRNLQPLNNPGLRTINPVGVMKNNTGDPDVPIRGQGKISEQPNSYQWGNRFYATNPLGGNPVPYTYGTRSQFSSYFNMRSVSTNVWTNTFGFKWVIPSGNYAFPVAATYTNWSGIGSTLTKTYTYTDTVGVVHYTNVPGSFFANVAGYFNLPVAYPVDGLGRPSSGWLEADWWTQDTIAYNTYLPSGWSRSSLLNINSGDPEMPFYVRSESNEDWAMFKGNARGFVGTAGINYKNAIVATQGVSGSVYRMPGGLTVSSGGTLATSWQGLYTVNSPLAGANMKVDSMKWVAGSNDKVFFSPTGNFWSLGTGPTGYIGFAFNTINRDVNVDFTGFIAPNPIRSTVTVSFQQDPFFALGATFRGMIPTTSFAQLLERNKFKYSIDYALANNAMTAVPVNQYYVTPAGSVWEPAKYGIGHSQDYIPYTQAQDLQAGWTAGNGIVYTPDQIVGGGTAKGIPFDPFSRYFLRVR